MKITQIKQQQRRSNYYSVFVDGRYSFSLPELKLYELGIKLDQSLTQIELNNFKKQSLEEKAYNACLNLIARRSRSEGELNDYMKRKQFDQDLIDKTMARLREHQLIDDFKFASSWVNNRVSIKHASIVQIKNELRKKHISPEIISRVLSEAEVDEVTLIKELIDKKRATPRYQDKLTMMRFLSRRGFSYDKIKQALEGDSLN